MRTHYSSLKSFLVVCLMCIIGTLGAYAQDATTKTYTYNAVLSDFGKGDFSFTSGGVTWSGTTSNGIYLSNSDAKGVQIGSKKNNGPLTLTTSDISGTIQSVVVNTSSNNNGNVSLTVSVGGKSVGTQNATSTPTDYTFTANASGEVKLSWTTDNAIYLKSITITYIPGTDPTPEPSGVTAPTFSESSKSFSNKFDLTLSMGSDAEMIMYTTDGTDPSYENEVGELYDAPISITHTTTVKAIAVSSDGKESDVVTEVYKLALPAPTISEGNKVFTDPFTVTLSTEATAAEAILYTLDGSVPSWENDATEIYTEPITISATTTLKAVSYASNGESYEYSTVATAGYTYQSGDEPESNVIWSEDWSGYEANAKPTEGTNATYVCTGNTKIYKEAVAGGVSPEIMVAKKSGSVNGSLKITINDLKGATSGLVFTFITNQNKNGKFKVLAENATILSEEITGNKPYIYKYIMALNEGAENLTITLDNGSTTNFRVDDLALSKYDGVGSFNITNAGYATYYTSDAYTMPEGVTGYTVTGNEGSALIMNDTYAAGTVVPAKTALLVKGEAGKYYTLATESTETTPADNKLHGSDASETTHVDGVDVKYYKLSYDTNGNNLGFYWGSENGAAFQNAAHKAYLALDGATLLSQKRGFSIIDLAQGITTGINDAVSTDAAKVNIFDINGRRINTLRGVAKGIYIVNGQKTLVK